MQGEVDHLAAVGHSNHAAVAVEVGSQPHMLNSHDADGMLQMVDGIENGGLAVFS